MGIVSGQRFESLKMRQASVGLPCVCMTLVTGLTWGPTVHSEKARWKSFFKEYSTKNPNVYNNNNKVEAQKM